MTSRRRALAIAACFGAVLMVALPSANASAWVHQIAGDFHTASISQGGATLEVRCRGKAVAVAYYLNLADLDPAVRGRPSAIFALRIDASDQVLWLQTKFLSDGNITSVGYGGPAADNAARLFAVASVKVTASLMITEPAPQTPQLNPTEFPLDGAADAIRATYAGCGIPW